MPRHFARGYLSGASCSQASAGQCTSVWDSEMGPDHTSRTASAGLLPERGPCTQHLDGIALLLLGAYPRCLCPGTCCRDHNANRQELIYVPCSQVAHGAGPLIAAQQIWMKGTLFLSFMMACEHRSRRILKVGQKDCRLLVLKLDHSHSGGLDQP